MLILMQTSELLAERLQAWKHAVGYLEDYVSATEKVEKAHAKEYEKVLKVCKIYMYRKKQSPNALLTDTDYFKSIERGPPL
jgi:hypothetical protein